LGWEKIQQHGQQEALHNKTQNIQLEQKIT
jgi:hypothetical protein